MVDDKSAINEVIELSGEGQKVSGPLGIHLPVDIAVWNEARRLVADKNVRVEDLATTASQDPVIVIDLLKISNAMYFSGGRPPITSVKTAIVRLGSEVVLEAFENLGKRPQLDDEDASHWLAIHRSRCKRTSIVARMISEVVIKNFSDECQAAGLLLYVGEMLAVAHLKENYVRLAEELSRSAINYRLAQDFRFDVERIGLNYLRRHGIPEILLFAIDREALNRLPERAAMKPAVMAAGEMVDAFDSNRWDKLSPGKTFPSKSAIRLLQMTEGQYLKLYEKASEYLFSIRLIEEKKKQQEFHGISGDDVSVDISSKSENALQSEINNIIEDSHNQPRIPAPAADRIAPPSPSRSASRPIVRPESDKRPDDAFGLKSLKAAPKAAPRVKTETPLRIDPPKLANSGSTKVVGEFANMFESANSSEELLSNLLGMLVKPGLFEKSALIVVSKDKKSALVVAARGPSIGNGQTLLIDDALSPLAECFSKVQSFGNKESKVSPFGSKAFAVAPIDADHDTPVALYADCGNEGSLSFESRRIFRTVVDILNQKLPTLPGGLPVEVEG